MASCVPSPDLDVDALARNIRRISAHRRRSGVLGHFFEVVGEKGLTATVARLVASRARPRGKPLLGAIARLDNLIAIIHKELLASPGIQAPDLIKFPWR
jgi:hypothetical protein